MRTFGLVILTFVGVFFGLLAIAPPARKTEDADGAVAAAFFAAASAASIVWILS